MRPSVITPLRPRTRINARKRLAHHEAGHAVLSAAINDAPHHVGIVGDEHTQGHSSQRMIGRPSSLAQVYLAGFAAEHILTGRRARQLDQEIGFSILTCKATDLLAAFDGADRRDGHRAVQEVLRMGLLRSDDEIRAEVERLYDATRASLASIWPAVQRVAVALLEGDKLDRDGIFDAIHRFDIYGPVLAVQRARGLLVR